MKALTDELDSQWSPQAIGRTSAGNREPKFDARPDQEAAESPNTVVDRMVDENTLANTRTGRTVGSPVRAQDRNTLTYKLEAADSPNQDDVSKFSINSSTGQILTKELLNHEDAQCDYNENDETTTCTYTVKVEVRDRLDEHGNKEADDAPDEDTLDDVIAVEIAVRDIAEPPAAPTVTVTSPEVDAVATVATLTVTWDVPENTGPPITGYEVECSGSGVTAGQCPQPISPTPNDNVVSYTIADLTPGSSYRVRVRATNDEGAVAWSSQVSQSTSRAGNQIPAFSSLPTNLSVAEEDARTGGTRIGSRVEATNGDGDGRVTYTLQGPDADLFTIDATGQIKTRSSLDHEDPRCYDVTTPSNTQCVYKVRVKISDRQSGSDSTDVTITVTDSDEPPSAPSAPRVTPTKDSGWSLDVTWNEPPNKGPDITGYEIQYRKTGTESWVDWDEPTETERKTTIKTILDENSQTVHLEPSTQYDVRVRALSGEGDATNLTALNWSPRGHGMTGKSNKRPTFVNAASLITLKVEENKRAGQNFGSAVEATDADRNRLTYRLEGPGKDSFDINSGTGQIRTKSGAKYDYETQSSYSVTVKVDDGEREANSVAAKSVKIEIQDLNERPSTPAAPRVTGVQGSTDSVLVTWNEPANTGPPITDYDVQCLDCPAEVSHDGADRSMIITGLTPGTRYNVQVRARSAEGHSDWSRSGTGTPNADVSNQRPIFSGGARTFNVEENSVAAGDPIGNPVTAVDPDLDTVTHTLEGADATSFDIDPGSGQIRATAGLNYEEKSRYSVTVRATDTRGGSSTVGVTITVTDVDEPPDTPLSPTVTAASSTSLQVTWDAPENPGPPITDYDYRYREAFGSWIEVPNTTITATTVTIEGLAASTSYDVEVRATNAEGTSDWSNSGYGSTAAAGANSPPVFSEGTSATRSVSATAQAGESIGQPVTATDADQGDTLTYSLEGTDAGSFDINTSTGQLITKAGVTLAAGTTYEVEVVASDGTDSARITVTIEATAGPPNNLPVFSDGASATRSVARSAPAGTAIGQPVRATDADAGTTLNYTLEGTDAASFDINSANGQLLTLAGVTLDQSTYTVDVVASDGTASARITVTINVVLNTAPEFASSSTSRSVVENGAAGTNVGAPVTATDADQGDTQAYSLDTGSDAGSFTINSSSGQISTSAVLDYETKNSYTVTVTATDSGNLTDTITVTISVTDVPEVFGCATKGAVADATNRGLVSDCEALRAARNKLEDGGARLNWFEGTPIDQWQGIGLGGTPTRVTRVDFRAAGLAGTVAAELGQLPMLRELNLRDNELTGTIPASLGRLTNLEKLLLHGNQLTGTIPNLSRLSNLKMLWLADNGLTGGIPTWLNSMSGLEELNLWGNDLGGSVPRLTGMTSLKLLKLQSNGLTGGVPAWFGDMNGPAILYLHYNELTGSIPSNLGRNTGVVRLWLDRNDLTGPIPSQLSGMTSLRTLNLRDNRLSGSIPAALGDMSNLQQLRLHNNMLEGAIPAELGNLSSLIQFWASNNMLEGAIPAELGNLSSLQQLNLHTNQLSGAIPSELSDLGNLTQLRVSNNQLTGSIPSDLGDLSNLQQLDLHTNMLEGDIPSALGRLSNLTRLRIGGVDGNPGNTGLTGCVPSAIEDATDRDDLALAGSSGISICSP